MDILENLEEIINIIESILEDTPITYVRDDKGRVWKQQQFFETPDTGKTVDMYGTKKYMKKQKQAEKMSNPIQKKKKITTKSPGQISLFNGEDNG